MKNLIFTAILSLFTLTSWAGPKGTGPYKKSKDANLAQKIVHILDNSTVGAVQTVLGGAHVIVFGILNPIRGVEKIKLGTHSDETNEVNQIKVVMDAPNTGAYSLGLFQVGERHEDHEGGHSVASATLGPLYLPGVALSYLIQGHDDSFFEAWADLEADSSGYMNTSSAQVGLGSTILNGEKKNVVVFKFNLEQRSVQEHDYMKSDKIFQWLNTKIVAPLVRNQGTDEMPLLIEFDVLKKKLNLVIGDNVDEYLRGDDKLRQVIQTEQRYGHIENNMALKQVHIKALDWSARYGLQYNFNKKFSVTPLVGVGTSAGAMSQGGTDYKNFRFNDNYDFSASFNVVTGVDINIFNFTTLTGLYKKEYYSNGTTSSTWSGEFHNQYRDPFKKVGFIQYLDFGIGARTEKWESPTDKSTLSQWNATLGFRY